MGVPMVYTRGMASPKGYVRFRKGAWRLAVYKGRNLHTGKDEYEYATHHGPQSREGRREAQLAAARLLIKISDQRSRDVDTKSRDARTVGEILDSYVTWGQGSREDGQRGKRKPWSAATLNTTASIVAGRIKSYEIPSLRQKPLGDLVAVKLTSDLLQEMYDYLIDPDGLKFAESYAARIHSIIHAAFERAVKKGWVDLNVAHYVEDKPSQEGKPIELPTETEMALLFQACAGDPAMEAWLLLAMSFGARRGAMCALRWLHLDLDDGYVTFERAISDGGKAYGLQEKGLKADNPFTATLNELEVQRLVALRDTQRRKAGPIWRDDFFVFGSGHGLMFMHPSSATHKFTELRDRAGVSITLHQLKHYGVTNLLKMKVPLIEVAARVGTNQRTIERRYAQWMRGLDERSASAMTGLQSRLLGEGATVTPIAAAVER